MLEENNTFGVADELSEDDDAGLFTDADLCDEATLNKLFGEPFYVGSEEAVSLHKNYILHLSATNDFSKIAAGGSDGRVYLYDITATGLVSNTDYFVGTQTLCGLKYVQDNMIFAGTSDGHIQIYDTRTSKCVATLEDKTTDQKKPITCFDVNQNNRVCCAGTEEVDGDVFLLFFDMRQRSLLGGYWESHNDDVTQVKFHPKNPDTIASGSTDGLINVFDISEATEDDALQYCLNTESSVQFINWHKNVYDKDLLSCITHTDDFKMYNVEESELIMSASRDAVTDLVKRKTPDFCNLIGCHNMTDNEIMVLTASRFNQGNCLRGLRLDGKALVPFNQFVGNKQNILTSLYSANLNLLVTAGENGCITLWDSSQMDIEQNKSSSKIKSAEKSHGNKPY